MNHDDFQPQAAMSQVICILKLADRKDKSPVLTTSWWAGFGMIVSAVFHLWLLVALAGIVSSPDQRLPSQRLDMRLADFQKSEQPSEFALVQIDVNDLPQHKDRDGEPNEVLAAEPPPPMAEPAAEPAVEEPPVHLASLPHVASVPSTAELIDAKPSVSKTDVNPKSVVAKKQPSIKADPAADRLAEKPRLASSGTTTHRAKRVSLTKPVSLAKSTRPASRRRTALFKSEPDVPVGASCSGRTLGTKLAWAESADAASKQAARQSKLVFLMHVSGNFAREEFT